LPAPATKISSLLVPTKISTLPLPKWSIAYFESLVGAPMSDLSGKVDAGKSYVVFGKKDNTATVFFAEDNIGITCV
jgi:hypothetical protein